MEGEQKFADLLRQVKATCLEAYENQDTPFEKIVDVLQPERNLAINPIFQVMFILQNADMGAVDPRFSRYDLQVPIAKFDLTVMFTETPQGLAGSVKYSTALFKPETIARMAGHFTSFCRAIVAAPTARICEFNYIEDAEKQRLLLAFNNTHADYPNHEWAAL